MALELWETLKLSIQAYTGLSPPTFFTIIALTLALYYVVSGLFGSSSSSYNNIQRLRSLDEDVVAVKAPVEVGEISEQELKEYDGSDVNKPLLMAIKGIIYDVSQSRMFYGPGGPYALFAGKDASRALAKMSFEETDLTGDISGLGPFELEALQDWEYKFMTKYVKVGTIKKEVPVTEPSSSEPTEAAEATDRGAPKLEEDQSSEKPTGEETVETTPVVNADNKDK